MRIRARILGVAASVCLLGLALPASAAPSTKATLSGSVPAWATSANFKGAAVATGLIGFRVYLGWQNSSQAAAAAKAVSDPKSASYKHFLTSQQFRQQFSPSQAQVGSVQTWLRGQGFSVNYTPMNNHYVSAEGTVAQAAAAFGTTFGMYSVSGQVLRSPSSNITSRARGRSRTIRPSEVTESSGTRTSRTASSGDWIQLPARSLIIRRRRPRRDRTESSLLRTEASGTPRSGSASSGASIQRRDASRSIRCLRPRAIRTRRSFEKE